MIIDQNLLKYFTISINTNLSTTGKLAFSTKRIRYEFEIRNKIVSWQVFSELFDLFEKKTIQIILPSYLSSLQEYIYCIFINKFIFEIQLNNLVKIILLEIKEYDHQNLCL